MNSTGVVMDHTFHQYAKYNTMHVVAKAMTKYFPHGFACGKYLVMALVTTCIVLYFAAHSGSVDPNCIAWRCTRRERPAKLCYVSVHTPGASVQIVWYFGAQSESARPNCIVLRSTASSEIG